MTEYAAATGYQVVGPEVDRHGYLNFDLLIPQRESNARLCFNSEVFMLSLAAGYDRTEVAHPDDGVEVLRDLLALVDAYADPATEEVLIKRRYAARWSSCALRTASCCAGGSDWRAKIAATPAWRSST